MIELFISILFIDNNESAHVVTPIPLRSTVSDIKCNISLLKPFPIHTFDMHHSLFTLSVSPSLQTSYLSTFRRVYTVGYATSLISLITAIVVFTAFR